MAVLVASVLALAFLLTGLTTDASGTNDPESERADQRRFEAFPPDPNAIVTDVAIVRSAQLTVDDEHFRRFVEDLEREGRAPAASPARARTYDTRGRLARLGGPPRDADPAVHRRRGRRRRRVIDVVERADADPEFAVAITGNQTRDHDFNELSEQRPRRTAS